MNAGIEKGEMSVFLARRNVGKSLASLMLEDIVDVQPMSEASGEVFKMKSVSGIDWEPGDIYHAFARGWFIRDNDNKEVPLHEFLQKELDIML